jgi:hypothetical protein
MLTSLYLAAVMVCIGASTATSARDSGGDDAVQRRLSSFGAQASSDARVAESLRVNGRAMVIRHSFVDALPGEIVRGLEADGFRAATAPGGVDPPSPRENWRILARADGTTLETWQVRARATRGSEVIVSVAAIHAPPRHVPPSPIGLPPGGQIVSTTESTDRGRLAVQHIVHARLTPSRLREWVRSSAAARGWRESWSSVPTSPEAGFVVVHRRGRSELTSVAAPAPGGVRLMLNHVEEKLP